MVFHDIFESAPGFCPDCGSILPLLRECGKISCYKCSREFSANAFGNVETIYEIHFNSLEACAKNVEEEKKSKKSANEEEGPVVEKRCPKCGNEKMSYATLQLRSADEGQTVFYTCTKCKFKETENS